MSACVIKQVDAGSSKPGDIVASFLEQAEFSKNRTGTWVLAAGQDTSGKQWAYVGVNGRLPDLRGKFLRGMNQTVQGVGGMGSDKDTHRSVGGTQDGQVGPHRHYVAMNYYSSKGESTRIPGHGQVKADPTLQGKNQNLPLAWYGYEKDRTSYFLSGVDAVTQPNVVEGKLNRGYQDKRDHWYLLGGPVEHINQETRPVNVSVYYYVRVK